MQVYMKLKTGQQSPQQLVKPYKLGCSAPLTVEPDHTAKNGSKPTEYLPKKLPSFPIQLRIARLSVCGSKVMGPIRNEKGNQTDLGMRRFGCRQRVGI